MSNRILAAETQIIAVADRCSSPQSSHLDMEHDHVAQHDTQHVSSVAMPSSSTPAMHSAPMQQDGVPTTSSIHPHLETHTSSDDALHSPSVAMPQEGIIASSSVPAQLQPVPALMNVTAPTSSPADAPDQEASGSRKRAHSLYSSPHNSGITFDLQIAKRSMHQANANSRKALGTLLPQALHPHDFGLTNRVIGCTGAFCMLVARFRALLWSKHVGPISMGKMFLVHLDQYVPNMYDWALHYQLRGWLQPPCHLQSCT